MREREREREKDNGRREMGVGGREGRKGEERREKGECKPSAQCSSQTL